MDDYEAAMSRLTAAAHNLAQALYLQRQLRFRMGYDLALRNILRLEYYNPTLRPDQCTFTAALHGVLLPNPQIYSLN